MDRFTISLDEKLAQEFDAWIAARAYANRSEAVRDLLRAELERGRQAHASSRLCVACLSYVFKHHERDLGERVTQLQHAHHELTVASMHAHLDHEFCLETVLLRGPTAQVRAFADAVCAERGVMHGKLNLISVDQGGGHGPHSHHGHPSHHGHQDLPGHAHHQHLTPSS